MILFKDGGAGPAAFRSVFASTQRISSHAGHVGGCTGPGSSIRLSEQDRFGGLKKD